MLLQTRLEEWMFSLRSIDTLCRKHKMGIHLSGTTSSSIFPDAISVRL